MCATFMVINSVNISNMPIHLANDKKKINLKMQTVSAQVIYIRRSVNCQ